MFRCKNRLSLTIGGASLLVALTAVTSPKAWAGPSHFYARLNGGASFNTIDASGNATKDVGTGGLIGGTVGYQFDNGFSTELGLDYNGSNTIKQASQTDKVGSTINYRAAVGYYVGLGFTLQLGVSYFGDQQNQTSLTAATALTPVGTTAKTNQSALTIMPQVSWGFPITPMIIPFATVGVGYARNTTGNGAFTGGNSLATLSGGLLPEGMGRVTGGSVKGITSNSLAYRLGAGVDFPVSPAVDIVINYTYMNQGEFKSGATSLSYDATANSVANGAFGPQAAGGVKQVMLGLDGQAAGTSTSQTISSNVVTVGVSYKF
ncbi:MAG: outer membrane beta-barrel protein [Candidatus Symbiobacter sp.]|nr:outer membrane beta-barrel protein [Candidatus Symbiobacter sp.]